MYLHKISFDKNSNSGRKVKPDMYSLHQKIWELVSRSEHQKRDFLYRVEYDAYQNIRFIYLLAPQQVTSQENIKVAVSPKFRPQIETGENLYFKLRANPIVKKKENGRPIECDIVMDAKHKFKKKGEHYLNTFSMEELIHNVGMKWLVRKGELHGFFVKEFDVRVDNYQDHPISVVGKQGFSIKTLDFDGVLKVTEPELFRKILFNGIGPAKSFGCGLMLVRRV